MDPAGYGGDDAEPAGMSEEDLERWRGVQRLDYNRLKRWHSLLAVYGAKYPDSYAGLIFARRWDDPPRTVLVASFKTDIDKHCRELVEMMGAGPRLEVLPVTLSHNDRKQLAANFVARGISAFLPSRSGPVKVILLADQEALAAELVDEYGDVVAIEMSYGGILDDATVAYPPNPDWQCLVPPVGSNFPSLSATIETGGSVSRVTGGTVVGLLELSGGETHSFNFGTQQPLRLYRPGSDAPVATYTGAVQIGSRSFDAAGSSTSYPFDGIVGVTPCDLTDGYLLEPGDYEVRGPIEVGLDRNDGLEQLYIYFEPVKVTVTD